MSGPEGNSDFVSRESQCFPETKWAEALRFQQILKNCGPEIWATTSGHLYGRSRPLLLRISSAHAIH